MSEKQREKAKKAQAQLQKTQKDEKKAQADNVALFAILVRFIENPLYEELIPSITELLTRSFPSRFILTIVAIIYPEAAQYLFATLGKHEEVEKYMHLHRYPENIPFDDRALHASIREWITLWLARSQTFLTHPEGSTVLKTRLLALLSPPHEEVAKKVLSQFFQSFLSLRNVTIGEKQADTYAEFILSEYKKSLREYMKGADMDLAIHSNLRAEDLFGL